MLHISFLSIPLFPIWQYVFENVTKNEKFWGFMAIFETTLNRAKLHTAVYK